MLKSLDTRSKELERFGFGGALPKSIKIANVGSRSRHSHCTLCVIFTFLITELIEVVSYRCIVISLVTSRLRVKHRTVLWFSGESWVRDLMSNVFVPKLIATRPNLWLCCFLSECIFSYSLTDTELNITLYIDFKLHQSLTFGDFRIYSSLILYAPGPIWEVSFWFAITSRFIRGFRSPSIKYYKILMVTIRLIISQGLLFPLIVALVVES